jgi:hypothetical protein
LINDLSYKVFPNNYELPNLWIKYIQIGVGSVTTKFPYFKNGTSEKSQSFAFVLLYLSHYVKVNN